MLKSKYTDREVIRVFGYKNKDELAKAITNKEFPEPNLGQFWDAEAIQKEFNNRINNLNKKA